MRLLLTHSVCSSNLQVGISRCYVFNFSGKRVRVREIKKRDRKKEVYMIYIGRERRNNQKTDIERRRNKRFLGKKGKKGAKKDKTHCYSFEEI